MCLSAAGQTIAQGSCKDIAPISRVSPAALAHPHEVNERWMLQGLEHGQRVPESWRVCGMLFRHFLHARRETDLLISV